MSTLSPTEDATHASPLQPRLTGRRCNCHGCGELFNSEAAFAAHRTGPFSPISEINTRRCLSPSEMRANGMDKTDSGYWITGESPWRRR